MQKWCFQIVALEKTLENPLEYKELKPVHPEDSLEGLMLKLKLQYFGHLIQRGDLVEQTLILGKTEGKKEKRAAEDEMVREHHQLTGLEFE